ncbi:MAG: excinuclease ABC subunit UvrC [Planctomycetes bacterium]|nr:excinuclease ABC subunit UvrC [Planctomycetota bacterium]
MPVLPFASSSLEHVPAAPGVYLFLGERKEILYVGKALNLRSRVRSYFNKSDDGRLVTVFLHRFARGLDFLVTGSEQEALILENSLIKKHAPKFNVRLRDDKTYFSLRLDLKHEWPWFTIVRKRKDEDGVLYFGPYTSASACRSTLNFLNSIFPLRSCRDSVLYNRSRPCISHEIGRCVAPCVDLVDRESYRRLVDEAVQFLRGRNRELVAQIEDQMQAASARLDFEQAALLRDRIKAIETTIARPHVTRNTSEAFDVIGLYRAADETHLCILMIRDGQLSSSSSYRFPAHHESDELLRSFLGQFYSPTRLPPAEVVLPEDCAELELMAEMLGEMRGSAVRISVPERGEKRRQALLATRNAELAWMQRHERSAEVQEVLGELRRQLDLVHLPRRIECYDISNLMGAHVVGSGVAFLDGRPDKNRYRRYKIKSVVGQDDFKSMAEVIRRRLQRGLREDDLPDLIVIDGGRAQLEAAMAVVRELAVDRVDFVGLAKARSGKRADLPEKGKERVFKPELPVPIILDQKSPEMKLLVRLRDEAHRFAISYHRRLRAKSQVSSILEHVPGIGKQRARQLLKAFGSVAAVCAASDAELEGLPGVTAALIARMREFFATRGHLEDDLGEREED